MASERGGEGLTGATAVFRVSLGGPHGLGALIRVPALTAALGRIVGNAPTVTLVDGPREACNRLARRVENAVWLGPAPSWSTEERAARELGGATLVVLDRFRPPAAQQRTWNRAGEALVVVDPSESAEHVAGLLVHAGATTGDRPRADAEAEHRVGGAEFAIVPSHRAQVPNPGRPWRLVVALDDPECRDAEMAVLSAIATASDPLDEITVLGDAPAPDDPRGRFLRTLPLRFRPLEDAPEVLSRATLAVTSGGTARLLALSRGVPVVAVALRPREEDPCREVATRGAGLDLGPLHALTPRELGGSVARLITYPSALLTMRRAAREFVDGRGGDRLLERALGRVSVTGGVA